MLNHDLPRVHMKKKYVPPFLRAPDHHLWSYFKNSPDDKTLELATGVQ